MRLLDLFCGAGGATKGYQEAGFWVIGVDHKDQPRYVGDDFHKGDALEFLDKHGAEFDAIHASPPCQAYTQGNTNGRRMSDKEHPRLIEPTRFLLQQSKRPYVIENVLGAPLRRDLVLSGGMFGLPTIRKRYFECSFFILAPDPHNPPGSVSDGRVIPVYSGKWKTSGSTKPVPKASGRKEAWSRALGIDWMSKAELSQAIPPAYTKFIGERLLAYLQETI